LIPITRPYVGAEEQEAAAAAIRSGWLSQGPRVRDFERAVAGYAGAGEAVAVSSCTAALHLALLAAGVGPGDEVICPSFSFIATANAALYVGATPVFVDIEPGSYNIDVNQVEAAIGPRTRCLMPVDQFGLAADIPAFGELARGHGLTVVEDAAPAIGAAIGEARVGSLSEFTCFSFHPRKVITAGEGGMIMTNDPDAAKRLRSIRSHGASLSDLARHESEGVEIEEYGELGYNYRMTDIQGAIGLAQLTKLDAILAARRRLAARYGTLLAGIEGVAAPATPRGRTHTFQSYCVRLARPEARPRVMRAMAARGVATRRGAMAIHTEPFYRARYPGLSLPATEEAARSTLLLPLYPAMTETQQDTVIEALRDALAGG
jgi:dTDP-4-amino-4,6-dideoxygalactose transaminase